MLQPRSMNSTASQSSNSGCDGRAALRAEIFDCLDDASAEKLFPDPVDGHAGRQRILPARQPSGQREPVGRLVGRQRREHSGRGRVDLFTLAQEGSPDPEIGRSRLGCGALSDHQRAVDPELVQFLAGGFQAAPRRCQRWRNRAVSTMPTPSAVRRCGRSGNLEHGPQAV